MALVGGNPLPRLAERLARITFDLVDSWLGGRAPAPPGAIEQALVAEGGPYDQHPNYRSYWYDQDRHSMVGLHLGLDLARFENAYHIIELNIGAGMRPQRRGLYPEALDPVVSGAIGLAAELGFERFVPMAKNWSPTYVEEFDRAGKAAGLEVVPTRLAYWPGSAAALQALPNPLQPKTFYWIHSGVMTPLIFYLHDKWSSSRWLAKQLPSDSLVRPVPTFDQLTYFDPQSDRWPNLVAKLNHSDSGKHVVLGRFADMQQARDSLGVRLGGRDIPSVLRRGLVESVRSRVFGGDWAIYQPFIPSDQSEGRIQLIRLHLLVSPLADRYLSAHCRLSHQPAPLTCPQGLQPPKNPYMGSYPATADYARIAPAWEAELTAAAQQVGAAVGAALQRKFKCC